jgi:hypothetical protein
MIILNKEGTEEIKDSVEVLIQKNLDKGNKYLLWTLKDGDENGDKKKKYKYLSVIKGIKSNGDLHCVDYILDEEIEGHNEYLVEEMFTSTVALNTRNFNIYIASEEEVKPYLKEVLVMTLMHEAHIIKN